MTSKMHGIEGLGSGNLITAARRDGSVEFETHYTVASPSKLRLDLSFKENEIILASKEFKIIFYKNCIFEFRTEPENFLQNRCMLSEGAVRSLRAGFGAGNPERMKQVIIETLEDVIDKLGKEAPHNLIFELARLTQELKLQCRIIEAVASGRMFEMEALSQQARKTSNSLKALSLGWITGFNTAVNASVHASDYLASIERPNAMSDEEFRILIQKLKELLASTDSSSQRSALLSRITECKKENLTELKETVRNLDEELTRLKGLEKLRLSLPWIIKILKRKRCVIRLSSYEVSLLSLIRVSNEAIVEESNATKDPFHDAA